MKFYAVKIGRTPGIYTSWDDCKKQVQGFPKALYKAFTSRSDAEKFIESKKETPNGGLIVYCDGSYIPPRAGSGVYVPSTGQAFYSNVPGEQTNNRGELYAVIVALQKLQGPLQIYTDSLYVVNIFNGSWKATENKEMIETLFDRAYNRDIRIAHVYGHDKDTDEKHRKYNDIADIYAKKGTEI